MTRVQRPEFKIANEKIFNGLTIEASAGSGKTFSVVGMVAIQLATRENLRISQILITTFTRNAAAELRDRVRRQLVSLHAALSNEDEPIAADNEIANWLAQNDRAARAARLDRAIREFDTATISTIHSVCARVLTIAGLPVVGEGRASSEIESLVATEVNSRIVTEFTEEDVASAGDIAAYSRRVVAAVKELLSSPRSVLSVDGAIDESGDDVSADIGRKTRHIVRTVAGRIADLTASDPTFDDLLLRTAEILGNGPNGDPAVAKAFRERFLLAVIDEAQDTDALQWEIFRSAFDADEDSRALITVGDPKQAIYRFRGADVQAYLANRDESKVQTLARNWRSDKQLVAAMNAVFADNEFGDGIEYLPVTTPDTAPDSSISGFPALSVINLGKQTNARSLVGPTARRVRQLLDGMEIEKQGKMRGLLPEDICVLVRSRTNGRLVEAALRALRIPAVSSGTESVMNGVVASDLTRVVKAMAEMSNESRLRLAAATAFLGADLTDIGAISDDELQKHGQTLLGWNNVLRRKGVGAWAHTMRSDTRIMTRLVSGREGERRETDFAHVIELLHAATKGKGCSAHDVLAAIEQLSELEATAETVSRRVESDRPAVQIMTVHASKGLEFPVVVVADLWKMNKSTGSIPSVPVFHRTEPDGTKHRVIDVGWVVGSGRADKAGADLKSAEEQAESRRLFYVAMTRAKHHVSLIHAGDDSGRVTDGIIDRIEEHADGSTYAIEPPPPPVAPYAPGSASTRALAAAPVTRTIRQTYQRLSFSGITKHHRGDSSTPVDTLDSVGGGEQDDDQIITVRSGYSDDSVKAGVPSMPLARLMGGTYFGKVMHKVYELLDFTAADLRGEVERVIDSVVVGAMANDRDALIDGVVLSLRTPLGGPLGDMRLADIAPTDRIAEMNFEIGLAGIDAGVTVSDVAALVRQTLVDVGRSDDDLVPYLEGLERSFRTQIVGLMNGSIDALLRVKNNGEDRYFVTDYKTNRLDLEGVNSMIDGYARHSMLDEMQKHDYPLQAIIYGVSVYRYLRWAQPGIDADAAVAGFAYFFVRGMVGPETPQTDDHRHGVFTWQAPVGLWSRLSDLFSGVKA